MEADSAVSIVSSAGSQQAWRADGRSVACAATVSIVSKYQRTECRETAVRLGSDAGADCADANSPPNLQWEDGVR